jgi:hypothetical protein
VNCATRDLQNWPRPCPLRLHLFWRQERRDPDVSLPHDIMIEHCETITAIPCRRRRHTLRRRRLRRRPLCAMTNLIVNATDRCGRRGGHPHILEWLRGRLQALLRLRLRLRLGSGLWLWLWLLIAGSRRWWSQKLASWAILYVFPVLGFRPTGQRLQRRRAWHAGSARRNAAAAEAANTHAASCVLTRA